MKQSASGRAKTRKFVNDKHFKPYTQPKMVAAAADLLAQADQSEEAFLGAQAVLLLNGMI